MQLVEPKAQAIARGGIEPKRPALVSVLGGKGGVGKTVFAANLAVTMALEMKGVLLVDCDLCAGQAHLVLGVSPAAGLAQAVRGGKRLSRVASKVLDGLHFVPGGPPGSSVIELRSEEIRRLAVEARLAAPSLRAVVFDAGAGRAPAACDFAGVADIPIVLTTPEPTAIRATVALLEAMLTERPEVEPYLVVNMAADESDSRNTYSRIVGALMPVYSVEPHCLGWLPRDDEVSRSLFKYKPVVTESPHSRAARGFRALWASLAPNLGLGRARTGVGTIGDESVTGSREDMDGERPGRTGSPGAGGDRDADSRDDGEVQAA